MTVIKMFQKVINEILFDEKSGYIPDSWRSPEELSYGIARPSNYYIVNCSVELTFGSN